MITLITGVPGSGKTLYSLVTIRELAEKSGRPVYQSGINALTLPWELFGEESDPAKPHETDASKWYELPKGSIIVIDEAQRLFRMRAVGSKVPEYVAQLETHRHKGYDIFLITQHPNLLDTNVRRLVGQHFHVVRKFGMHKAKVAEWTSCSDITQAAIGEAVQHEFSYPAEAFAWYKSAEVHTHKRRIPARVWFLWLSPLMIAGLVYVGYLQVRKFMSHDKVGATVGSAAGLSDSNMAPKGAGQGLSRGDWISARAPRLRSLSYTAPVYDELTKPTRVPVPAACVRSSARCQCYTQDGTVLDVDYGMCTAIVDRGIFLEFDPNGQKRGDARDGDRVERPRSDLNRSVGVQVPVTSDVHAGAVDGPVGGPSGGYSAVPLSSPDGYDPVALSAPRDNSGMHRAPTLGIVGGGKPHP